MAVRTRAIAPYALQENDLVAIILIVVSVAALKACNHHSPDSSEDPEAVDY